MTTIEVGQPAPSFRLPSGHGPEIGLEDFRGRNQLVVWFTKGMACPFCRTQMSQLALGYPRLKAVGAEVLQITPSPPERARFYARNFSIPFPYLCDPDYTVHQAWGLGVRSHSLAWYARSLYAAVRMPKPPPAEIGDPPMRPGELRTNLQDTDMGFFLLDRAGIVRYRYAVPYNRYPDNRIPSVDDIIRRLEDGPGAKPSG
jgi:peroxiredoxin